MSVKSFTEHIWSLVTTVLSGEGFDFSPCRILVYVPYSGHLINALLKPTHTVKSPGCLDINPALVSEVKTWHINSANPGPVTGDRNDYKLLTSGCSIVSVFIPHSISLSCSPRLVKYCTSTSLPSLISRLFSTRSSSTPSSFTSHGESFSFNAGIFLSSALGERRELDGLWLWPFGERRVLDGLWRPERCGLRGALSPKVPCCPFIITPHADTFSFSWSCGVGLWCPWDTPSSARDTPHWDNRSSKSLFVLPMFIYMPTSFIAYVNFTSTPMTGLLCETGI